MYYFLVDIHWLKENLGEDIIWNFDKKLTDGTPIFANLGKGLKFWNDYIASEIKIEVWKLITLHVQDFRQQKNYPLPI